MYENLEGEILQKDYIKITTIISFCISILFICIHLIVFLINPYTRTIMGKCFAMFCMSLLLGYFTFVGSIVLRDMEITCKFVAIAGHYIFLAQTACLLVTSIESWKSIKTSKSQQEFERQHSWRFVLYSLFAFLEPMVVVALATFFEFGDISLPENLKPQLSDKTCRFGQMDSFFYFYLLPVSVNIILNLHFLVSTSSTIRNIKIRDFHFRDTIEEFGFYLKLNFFICLVWMIGLVGEYMRSDVLLLVYVVFNALQSLYLFLMITFNNKISSFIYYDDTFGLTVITREDNEKGIWNDGMSISEFTNP